MFPIEEYAEKITPQGDSALIDDSNQEQSEAVYLVAGNQELSADLIVVLSQSDNYRIRVRIAENSCTTAILLNELAQDRNPEVRVAVADNRSAPYATLEHLAEDECADVRYALAENSQLPFSILLHLMSDDNPYVASRARKTADRVSHAARQGVLTGCDHSTPSKSKHSIRNFVKQTLANPLLFA